MLRQSAYVSIFGRLLIASLFLISGCGKAIAPAATEGYIASVGLPAPLLGLLISIAVEIGGGILLIVGYRTRFVALVMAAFSVATALVFHNDFADQNMFIHFMKNISIAGGLLQVAAFGGGTLSIDSRRMAAATTLS